MSFDRHKVLFGQWKDVTGDPDRDLLICALTAVEARLGERRGWDKPPRVMTLHLTSIDARIMEVRILDSATWRRGYPNPGDDLTALARMLPPPHELPPLRFADSPDGLAAVAFMCESWMADLDDFAPAELARQLAGERTIVDNPKRVEARQVVAADINGHEYALVRRRDRDPEAVPLVDSSVVGNVPNALRRIALATRAGNWPT